MLFHIWRIPVNGESHSNVLSTLWWILAPMDANMPVDKERQKERKEVIIYVRRIGLECEWIEKVDTPNIERIIMIIGTVSERGARCFHEVSDHEAFNVLKEIIDIMKAAIPNTKYKNEQIKFVIVNNDECLFLISGFGMLISFSIFIIFTVLYYTYS